MYYNPYYGFDWTYIVLVLPCLILSLWASASVKSTFRRFSKQYSQRGITGADAAARVLRNNGISNVRIEHVSGDLTDHFDPKANVMAMPLILLGIVLSFLGNFSVLLVYLGIACFALSLVFQLITLPVEFNASRRAIRAIQEAEILTASELHGAKKTLKAAAMTYLAATAVAFAQLLRLIILFGGRRRND